MGGSSSKPAPTEADKEVHGEQLKAKGGDALPPVRVGFRTLQVADTCSKLTCMSREILK